MTPKEFNDLIECYFEKAKQDIIPNLMLINTVRGALGGKNTKMLSPDDVYSLNKKSRLTIQEKIEKKINEKARDIKNKNKPQKKGGKNNGR
jgi:hypothetical protein